jgi:hypothetical protein
MRNFLRQLFIGPFPDPHKFVRPALQNQWKNITTIWNNDNAATFGIERLFRLFLAFSAYVFPGIYIRHFSGKYGLLHRKLALDLYVSFKVVFPAMVLWCHCQSNYWALFFVSYFGLETLLYVSGLMFLSDIYKAPISHKRSYLMFLMNYVEICLNFAVLYGGLKLVSNLCTSTDAAYFSFVTGFTVGYGDMAPNTAGGKRLVVFQSVCSLFFITVAFAKAVASFEVNHAKPRTDG